MAWTMDRVVMELTKVRQMRRKPITAYVPLMMKMKRVCEKRENPSNI